MKTEITVGTTYSTVYNNYRGLRTLPYYKNYDVCYDNNDENNLNYVILTVDFNMLMINYKYKKSQFFIFTY